ncbi:MAG: aminopeptidase [Solirubrobacteraceae bacterium]
MTALADLSVDAGINVVPGQTVIVSAKLGQEELARAIAAACYDRGAHQVQVDYADPYVGRARLQRAPEAALGSVIPWERQRPGQMAEMKAAWIGLSGPAAPGLLDDLDAGRIGRDSVALVEWAEVIDRGQISWTIIPGPTEAWARLVFGQSESDPLDALWAKIANVCRLDEPDPAAAWWQRSTQLREAADRLSAAQLDSLHFRGPGTDLVVGLLPGLQWHGGGLTNAWGRDHVPNLPTEEVFTSPDPERTEGTVTSTKPLLVTGRVVSGLRIRFEGGRAVQIDADEGASLLREVIRRDLDADRLGEVALVDGSGRVGRTGTVFHDTLLDENAASHIALGSGFQHLATDDAGAARVNSSGVHTDFMIGGPDVDVTGTTRDGREVPVLTGGEWSV